MFSASRVSGSSCPKSSSRRRDSGVAFHLFPRPTAANAYQAAISCVAAEQAGDFAFATAATLIDDPTNELLFSAASIWEIVIKNALGREDFKADPDLLRRELLDNSYSQLAIGSEHALAASRLPAHHKDPFDRILIAQAVVEGITLVTSDPVVASYPGPIRKV